jgi:membrane protease YdiL (CAAX protease family)
MERENRNSDFLLTCLVYLAVMILLLIIRFAGGMGWLNSIADEPLDVGFSIVSQAVIMFMVPYLAFKIYRNRRQNISEMPKENIFTDFGFHKISFRFVLLAFALGLMLYILNIFVAGFFANILDMFGFRFSSGEKTFTGASGLVISLVLIAMLPGFCEELTHRGMLLSNFQRKFGNYRAVMFVSLLFGLMHMNIEQFFYASVLGWFICMAVLASRSVWVGIIIHFTNNAVSTYLSYAGDLHLPGSGVWEVLADVNFLFICILLILVVIAIGEIMKYMARTNFVKTKNIYVARYLDANPNVFGTFDSVTGEVVGFEKLSSALEHTIAAFPTWKAVFAYCETHKKPEKMSPLERAVFVGLFVLGGLVTVFTFYWGIL